MDNKPLWEQIYDLGMALGNTTLDNKQKQYLCKNFGILLRRCASALRAIENYEVLHGGLDHSSRWIPYVTEAFRHSSIVYARIKGEQINEEQIDEEPLNIERMQCREDMQGLE